MRKLALLAASAVALSAAAPASAATYLNVTPSTITFGNTTPFADVGTNGKFNNLFTFALTYARTFSGSVVSLATNFPVDNVNFVSPSGVKISGGTLASPVNWLAAGSNIGNPEIRNSGLLVLGAGTYTISVLGSSGPTGQYNGLASLASVPEPTSWALMIIGFGAIGSSMRLRRRAARTVAA